MARTFENIIDNYRGRSREALLPVLWDVQTAFGWINAEAVRGISHALHIPEADIYGVISFYSMFHDKPTGESIIRVCTSPCCGIAGSDNVLHGLCSQLGIQEGETTEDGRYTIEHTQCLGMCEYAPAALISKRETGETVHAPILDVDSLLSEHEKDYEPIIGEESITLLTGLDDGKSQMLADYGDYAALKQVLETKSPDDVIIEVEQSGLIGRGGAAFPTAIKWKSASQVEATQRYVICNADESEPGTYKDRVLLEGQPHLILEGMALCAYAIGSDKGYIFVRGEYPKAAEVLQKAIDEAVAANILGNNVMGYEFSFHVEVRRGAGAYICGEETALFEAIEGKRGFPRIKPPYPTTHGLFNKPTVINNVETLCAVPVIIERGVEWFKQWGTEKSAGPKLVSVSGHVNRAGVYEISPGLTLRELLEKYCNGVKGNLQAVLMGGAAGTFLTPDEIDVPLTFEDLRAIESTFGSGAIMVFNDTVNLRNILRRLAAFFHHESCGKCFPCQLGTQRQMEIVQRLDNPLLDDRERLIDVGETMTEASLCGLGQTAASAILSAIEKWPELI